jgi:hypothetical protein
MEIDYEPRFLDEVVLRAAGTRAAGRLFFRERERIYTIADPEARGRAFDALNVAWWDRLGLGVPLAATLAERPLIERAVARCAVGRPPRRADAGAELLVRPAPSPGPADRLLRVLVAPETILAPDVLTPFLRRELLHVADMLEPRFGYEPHLPRAGGPAFERLLRDRYRAVWEVTVDGRLVGTGRLPAAVEPERRARFLRAFGGMERQAASAAFARFFSDPAPTHAGIVAFVLAPEALGAGPRAAACPLCGFPTRELASDTLPEEVIAAIAEDFPRWQPEDRCCQQCADLYHGRPLSFASAAALPGVR